MGSSALDPVKDARNDYNLQAGESQPILIFFKAVAYEK